MPPLLSQLRFLKAQLLSETDMNDNDRKVYKPAPRPGDMKCPKCNGDMKPSAKDPKVSVCGSCGFAGTRVRLS